jgi:hypothetical protein
MAKHVCVVLTNPVPGREDEFNEWYTGRHLDDVIRAMGCTRATRYELAAMDPPQTSEQRYLAIYEVETDDIDATSAKLLAAAGTAGLPLSDALDLTSLKMLYFEQIAERPSPR